MNEELDVLKSVSERLESAHIPYMITGSVAGNFYAMPRMTRDIDIVIEIMKKDTDRILALFNDDFYIDAEMIVQAIHDHSMFNIIHNQSVIKIDFIIRKDLPYRKLEFARRRPMEVGGTQLWVVSPEDLVLSKLHWAKDSQSEMQLRDVQNILSVVKNLDTEYLNEWIQSLNLEEIYSKVQS